MLQAELERILTKRVACSDVHFIKIDLEMALEEERRSHR